MEKKSRVLIAVFVLALLVALGYSYYRYILTGNFLIDESQVEAEEEVTDEMIEETVPEGDSPESAASEVEVGV